MVFTRLAPDKKFKANMRDKFTTLVLPAFENLVKSSFRLDEDEEGKGAGQSKSSTEGAPEYPGPAAPSPEDVAVIPSSFAVMAVLATDPVLRSALAGHLNLWLTLL